VTDVSDALDQIEAIHGHLAKSEVYRGWRPLPVAASGAIGAAAAAYQSTWARPIDPVAFTTFWLMVAAVAFVVGCAEIAWHYTRYASDSERRRSRLVVGQFLPALGAGGCITIAIVPFAPALAMMLPGIWALLFGVATFAARPYLPREAAFIAAFYWVAGLILLGTCRDVHALSPWMVGVPFSAGQLISAGVLYWTFERPARKSEEVDR
jgi:hypothetical protein